MNDPSYENTTPDTETTATPSPVPSVTEEVGSMDAGVVSDSEEPPSIEEIEAEVDREREVNGLPSLDESMKIPVDTSPDLAKPIREVFERRGLADGRIDNEFLNALYQVGQSAVYGLGSGLQEAGQAAVEFSDSPLAPGGAGQALGEGMGKLLSKTLFGTTDAELNAMDQQRDGVLNELHDSIPNIAELLGVPAPDNAVENVVAAITPVVASYMFGSAALEGIGLMSKLSSLRLPGLLGTSLGRFGVTGPGTGRTLIEMLKGAASTGIVLPEDSDNFASMLKGFSDRDDSLGSISRAWLNVPLVEALAHDEADDPLTRRFKNGLDAAYGELMGPLVYLMVRNAKVGYLAGKGMVQKHILEWSVRAQKLAEDVLTKLANDTNNKAALDAIELANDTNNKAALDAIYPNGPGTIDSELKLTGKVKQTDEIELDATQDNPNVVDESMSGKAPDPNPDEAYAPLPTLAEEWSNKSAVQKASEMLTLSPDDLQARIANAQAVALDREVAHLRDLSAYTKRFNTLINQTGKQTERNMFDADGYVNYLTNVVDDPVAFRKALNDWSSFMDYGDNPVPSLLTPRQVSAWDGTPMDVTGNVIDAVKRLTTTNSARKDEAVRFLADMLGNGLDADNRKLAQQMLDATATSTAEVDKASRLLVTNTMFLENSVVPDLNRAVFALSKLPNDESLQRTALHLIGQVNKYTEANKNLKSAAGRLLQSAQIDPKLEQSLRDVYGPEQYQAYFNPGAARTVEEQVAETAVQSVDDIAEAADASPQALTAGERAQIQMLQNRWGVVEPKERTKFVAGVYRAGQHPVWKTLGDGSKFAVDIMSNLTMSAMLFHPATWSRVFQGALTATLYDSGTQVAASAYLKSGAQAANRGGIFNIRGKLYESVFRGVPIDADTHERMMFGGMWRAMSLPYSMMVAGKSFIRPAWQDLYSLGGTMYKSSPLLGPEMIEQSFGKDVATRIFSSAGGVPGRVLRGVGVAMGVPQHILGSVETMINHGALSSRLAEELYSRAMKQGLRGIKAKDFVDEHIADLMDDALVAKSVPRGQVALRNRVNFNSDDLRNLVQQAGENADYTSLRETGRTAGSPVATTTLGDTVPFQLERILSEGVSKLPYVGSFARAVTIPFGRVSANIIHRSLSPAQAILSMSTRAIGLPGMPSRYIDEVLGGLHGPHRQAQLLGHTAVSTALYTLGIANMWQMRNSGRNVEYPLGTDATREATNERNVRYGETPLPDGGTVTTLGLNPFINSFNQGNYASWIYSKYGMNPFLLATGQLDPRKQADERMMGQEGMAHIAQLFGQTAPIAPLFQGLSEVFGAVSESSSEESGAFGALETVATGVASSVGGALERPMRLRDLWFGKQVPGRSTSIKDDGPERAFRTAMAGASGDPNMDRINSYDLGGRLLADKYDPDNGIDQFLEAYGLPSYRPYDESKLGQMLAELESHGIAMTTQPKKVSISIGGEIDKVPVNLQHYYNPKTKEHLWDVYNRLIAEQPVAGAYVRDGDMNRYTMKEALEEIAKDTVDEPSSKMVRTGKMRKRVLSDSANRMFVLLETMRGFALDDLQVYLGKHAGEFVNAEGDTLPEAAEMMYNDMKPPLVDTDNTEPSVETTE